MHIINYDTHSVQMIAEMASIWGVNNLKGMRGWGWRIPVAGYFVIGLLTLVFDSHILSLLPHLLTRMHLIHVHA